MDDDTRKHDYDPDSHALRLWYAMQVLSSNFNELPVKIHPPERDYVPLVAGKTWSSDALPYVALKSGRFGVALLSRKNGTDTARWKRRLAVAAAIATDHNHAWALGIGYNEPNSRNDRLVSPMEFGTLASSNMKSIADSVFYLTGGQHTDTWDDYIRTHIVGALADREANDNTNNTNNIPRMASELRAYDRSLGDYDYIASRIGRSIQALASSFALQVFCGASYLSNLGFVHTRLTADNVRIVMLEDKTARDANLFFDNMDVIAVPQSVYEKQVHPFLRCLSIVIADHGSIVRSEHESTPVVYTPPEAWIPVKSTNSRFPDPYASNYWCAGITCINFLFMHGERAVNVPDDTLVEIAAKIRGKRISVELDTDFAVAMGILAFAIGRDDVSPTGSPTLIQRMRRTIDPVVRAIDRTFRTTSRTNMSHVPWILPYTLREGFLARSVRPTNTHASPFLFPAISNMILSAVRHDGATARVNSVNRYILECKDAYYADDIRPTFINANSIDVIDLTSDTRNRHDSAIRVAHPVEQPELGVNARAEDGVHAELEITYTIEEGKPFVDDVDWVDRDAVINAPSLPHAIYTVDMEQVRKAQQITGISEMSHIDIRKDTIPNKHFPPLETFVRTVPTTNTIPHLVADAAIRLRSLMVLANTDARHNATRIISYQPIDRSTVSH